MPEEIEVEDLLGKEKVFVEWSAYFAGLKAKQQAELTPNARSGGSLESWEKIETPILEVFTQANRTLKTPKRLRLGALQAVDIATLPMPNERVEQFSSLKLFLLMTMLSFWRPRYNMGYVRSSRSGIVLNPLSR
jgi:hypothetical protein